MRRWVHRTADYTLGAVLSATVTAIRNGAAQPTSTTAHAYTATGVFAGVHIADGRARDVTVVNDVMGQALARDAADRHTARRVCNS